MHARFGLDIGHGGVSRIRNQRIQRIAELGDAVVAMHYHFFIVFIASFGWLIGKAAFGNVCTIGIIYPSQNSGGIGNGISRARGHGDGLLGKN